MAKSKTSFKKGSSGNPSGKPKVVGIIKEILLDTSLTDAEKMRRTADIIGCPEAGPAAGLDDELLFRLGGREMARLTRVEAQHLLITFGFSAKHAVRQIKAGATLVISKSQLDILPVDPVPAVSTWNPGHQGPTARALLALGKALGYDMNKPMELPPDFDMGDFLGGGA